VSGIAEAQEAFRSLPERYLGAHRDFDATYHLRLGDIGHTWEVRCTTHGARVRAGVTSRRPDVVIGTDAQTWLALRRGDLSGVEAFSQRRLYARGDLDLAVGFEGMFRLPNGRPPLLRIHDVALEYGNRVSTLTMGAGPDILLLHGLGATKASFLPTVAALADTFRIVAIDLPGFGDSVMPLGAPYDAPYFARAVHHVLDACEIERAHVVGNSMGGRVALEVGFEYPDRVKRLALLAPSLAWLRERRWAGILKAIPPELGLLQPAPRAIVESIVRNVVPGGSEGWSAVGVDEFLRAYLSPRGRAAFYAAARSIYLEDPDTFWSRLRELQGEALFVWGREDRLVPIGFARHVREALPAAEHLELDCGHVPQLEAPRATHEAVRRFLGP
jgi:pimeloyl-ACP methyl ester carboxylesterase